MRPMMYIAVRMLVGDLTKWAGVVLGVFFCTFLITHFLSMFSGMMQRTYALVTDIPEADIWVMDPAVQYVDEPIGLSDIELSRVRGVDGVEWATPLYVGNQPVRLPSGAFRSVLVIGVDDATLIGLPSLGKPLVGCTRDDLRRSDAVIVDAIGSKTLLAMPATGGEWEHGQRQIDFQAPTRPLEIGNELLVNDHRLIVVGKAELGPRFLARPVLYTTYSRATQVSPRTRKMLSFVLVHVKDGQNAAAMARRIEKSTGLRARTAAEFSFDTYDYYIRMTGVVQRIMFFVGIGVFVGIAVSSLLLYLFTLENARYYATLKALGTGNATIGMMVAVQAATCGACGYGVGVGVSALMGSLVTSDAIPYLLTPRTLLFAAAAMLLVTVSASILSARKVMRLEPAIVFK